MEQNLPLVARKFWNMVRVAFFMLRKGISKRKLMLDLNLMMKRGKIAGKAIHNLMFHHVHHHWSAAMFSSSSAASSSSPNRHSPDQFILPFPEPPPGEYEFSCGNSPALPNFNFPFNFNFPTKKKNHQPSFFSRCAHAPSTADDDRDLHLATFNEVFKALESENYSAAPSPSLPGFGQTPMVRQLRITDSPFPLKDMEEDNHVDEAAEKFIAKFYSSLKRQSGSGPH